MDAQALDLSRLAGFDQVEVSGDQGEIDFRGAELGAKVGAKRADVEAQSPSL